MANRWGDYIRQLKQSYFVGRQREKELFIDYLKNPQLQEKILYIWGPGGTGKSTLLDEFARLAKQQNACFIRLDSRDFPHSPLGFSKKLLSLIKDGNHTGGFEDCLLALHRLAETKKMVLAIDTYEEMQDLDGWLRDRFFGELTDRFLVVMAGRYPLEGDWLHPIWKRFVKDIPLSFFDLETTQQYASTFSLKNNLHIERLFSLSKGHPLTLSLLIGLSEKELAKDTEIDLSHVLKLVAESWLRELRGQALQELIEAAAMVRVFNQEMIEYMLQRHVNTVDFEQLVSLSFIRNSKRGWFVHDLLRPILLQEFKRRKPTIYRELWERAISYFLQALSTHSPQSEKALLSLEMVFLLEDFTLRSIFLTETSESGYYIAPVAKNQLPKAQTYMEQVLVGRLDVIQEFFDPQTHQRYESVMPFRYIKQAYEILSLEKWIQLGDDVIYLIHNEQHQAISMVVNIPIHSDSLPLLMASPISMHYFKNLSKTQLERLRVEPESPAGWFFYHIDQWLDHSPPARTAFFQFIMLSLMKPGLFLHSSPLKLHHDTVTNLGFQVVPGAEHHDYGDDFLAQTFQLDLRGEKYNSFLAGLIQNTTGNPLVQQPSSLKGIELLTPREQEIADWVLKGLTNVEIAKTLYISEITVKKHLSSIYEKLGVKGKTQLVQKLLEGSE